MTSTRLSLSGLCGMALASVLVAACAPAAPPSPTVAPAKPTEAAKAVATTPAKSTEAPVAKAAEKTAVVASPAAKPAEAKPVASPAAKAEAKPVTFDAKAIEDFYRGKTLRIVVGFGAGGGTDTWARIVARVLPRFVPGNPNVIVENKPGAGGLLAANLLYSFDPKDGTVIGAMSEGHPLQQAIGAPGIEFDAAKFSWVASFIDDPYSCQARLDLPVTSIQQLIDGRELVVGTLGAGSATHDTPAVLKAALGANFKLVPGYDSVPRAIQAIESKELEGYCTSVDSRHGARTLMGDSPFLRILVVMGDHTPDRPYTKGVPAAETLAKTDEARQMLRALRAPTRMSFPQALPPGVPQDRVAALRKAYADVTADAEFRAEAEKAGFTMSARRGEEVQRIVEELLATPQAVRAKLKDVLK